MDTNGFSGRVVASRPLRGYVVDAGGRTKWDALAGSLPGSVLWEEGRHGPIPPGWRMVRYFPAEAEAEIVPACYAPALRLVVLVREWGGWLRWCGQTARDCWAQRPRLVR